MDTKLTLKLNNDVIKKAKRYAEVNHHSLSKLVENYFFMLAYTKDSGKEEIGPISRSLSGFIRIKKPIDAKTEYADYLVNKYK